MTTKMFRASCRLKNVIIRLQYHHSPQRGCLDGGRTRSAFSWNNHIRNQHFKSAPLTETTPSPAYIKFLVCVRLLCLGEDVRSLYLNGPLLFADIVGLQLLRLWQRSADRRPETDSWDKRAAVELIIMNYNDDDDDDEDTDHYRI